MSRSRGGEARRRPSGRSRAEAGSRPLGRPPEVDVEQIKKAAIACVKRYSARKVSIDDIAAEARVGRQTIYRKLGPRQSIFATILLDRLRAIAEKVGAIVSAARSFEDAIVRGSVESIRLARADRVFLSIAESDRELGLDRLLLGADSPVRELFMGAWSGLLNEARAGGILRRDVTNEEAADWLRNVHYLAYRRDDLDPEEQAEFFRKFALPAITGGRRE